MLAKLRPRSVYDVLAAVGCFAALSTGGAYAANTIFSTDIVDGEVKTPDLASEAVTAQKLRPGAVGTDKVAGGAVTTDKVKDNSLGGRDVLDNTLKGADIDESTLASIGGGGPAGGDLTGSYPDPEIAPNVVGAAEIASGAVGGDALGANVELASNSISISPSGGVGEVSVLCPTPGDSMLLSGGAEFDFASGDLSASRHHSAFPGWTAKGQNNGNFAQNLTVTVICLGRAPGDG
jgi:hypothetical protein